MNNTVISAMVSMSGIQQRLDLLADNIANSNTVGYKRKEANFEDTLTRVQNQTSDLNLPDRATPSGFTLGFGSRMSQVTVNYAQGSIQETGNMTDLAIQGNAMFSVKSMKPDGIVAYTRGGDFHIQPDPDDAESAFLVNQLGYVVLNAEGEPITFPSDAKLSIDAEGNILATNGEGTTEVGRIALLTAEKPDVLVQKDGNLFVLAAGVDPAEAMVDTLTLPQEQRASLRQGALEASNVDLTEAMAEMLQVQRAYQLTARALTSGETMMGLANNLRG
ncbi:flagellar hook-basal body protein [Paenibacillus barengoltzii]|uniref:Flagellar basal-body rod protein FlgG n=1 Tax=Paenibacillus barengoltzii J12 TaxID=935846 RepID=A0ABY1LSD2_9BACL|nr:flagellar hook-basal body protein [Paenibacillus barengoltzii]SME94575.1 flagellar basal-body rod protein FlgG [Paenibacillus barengoltzii J12]